MLRLVGYTRISTELQKDNTSLSQQEQAIRGYCLMRGYSLESIYSDVESGGASENRDGFNQALLAVGAADGLIAYCNDRLARNLLDLLTLQKTLTKMGKELFLVEGAADTSTPEGQFAFQVGGAVAQLEKELINRRLANGRKAKRDRGEYAGGRPRYGQQAVNKKLEPLDSELETIDLIRRHHKSGKSLRQIADYLNAQGIPAKKGEKWNHMSVSRIIKRIYAKPSPKP